MRSNKIRLKYFYHLEYCPSFSISLDDALEIGRVFRQESIVFNDGQVIAVIECDTAVKVIELNHSKIYDKLDKKI